MNAAANSHEVPRWVSFGLVPLIQLMLAFAVAGLVILAIGQNPWMATKTIIFGAFGTGYGLGFTLFYATSLIFVGLAVAVAFHAGLFNIGGEGQAYIGGLGIAILAVTLDNYLPWFLLAPILLAGAIVFAAAWAYVPAVLQAYRGSHIVITTIMFNFIASALVQYMLVGPLIRKGAMEPATRFFEPNTWWLNIQDFAAWFGISADRSPFNITFLLALVASFLTYMLIWRSRLGYAIRTVGANPTAARYAGIDPRRIIVITMLISGALTSGLAINVLLGVEHRMQLDFVAGLGFTGIAVALMGRNHPVGIIIAALLFGALTQGGTELLFEMPSMTPEIVILVQGLVVLFAGALEYMVRPGIEASYLRIFGKGEA